MQTATDLRITLAICIFVFLALIVVPTMGQPPSSTAARSRPSAELLDEFHRYRLERVLDERTSVELNELPLTGVVEHLEWKYRIPIELDERALFEHGISLETQVTKGCRDIRLREALARIFIDVNLIVVAYDRRLLVTTFERAALFPVTRRYAVADLLDAERSTDSVRALLEMLDLVANPPRHKSTEQLPEVPARLSVEGGRLIVVASEFAHQRVVRQLAEIRISLQLPETSPPHPFSQWQFGRELDLSYLPLDNADLRALRPQPSLELINLRQAQIQDFDAHWLEKHSELLTLDLSGISLRDRQLESLTKLQELTTLIMFDTFVTDAGLARLMELRSLQTLTLGYRNNQRLENLRRRHKVPELSVDAIEKLRQQMPHCKITFQDERPKRLELQTNH